MFDYSRVGCLGDGLLPVPLTRCIQMHTPSPCWVCRLQHWWVGWGGYEGKTKFVSLKWAPPFLALHAPRVPCAVPGACPTPPSRSPRLRRPQTSLLCSCLPRSALHRVIAVLAALTCFLCIGLFFWIMGVVYLTEQSKENPAKV